MDGIKDSVKYEKKLSIIVPVYNVEKYLERCVDSLLHQDLPYEEYEIILINDGSTDNSYEIAKRLAGEHNNIVLLTQDNQGQSVARNRGIGVARGKYIMFVDSDDNLFPNVLNRILNTAERYYLDACTYRMICYDSKGGEHKGGWQPFLCNKVYEGKYALTHGAVIGSVCSCLFSKQLLNNYNLNFLEGVYHEDVDFSLRFYAFAKRMMFTDILAYAYNWNPNSTDRQITSQKTVKQMIDVAKIVKHIRDFANSELSDFFLIRYYSKYCNSMLISIILKLRKQKDISFETKLSIVSQMKDLQLYPIRGRALSWKSSVLILFFNINFILNKYIK